MLFLDWTKIIIVAITLIWAPCTKVYLNGTACGIPEYSNGQKYIFFLQTCDKSPRGP